MILLNEIQKTYYKTSQATKNLFISKCYKEKEFHKLVWTIHNKSNISIESKQNTLKYLSVTKNLLGTVYNGWLMK